jgi:MoxR-like ATPase
LATQKPIEMEGTYPLPEAQLDRFMFKLLMGYPSEAELAEILNRTTGDRLASIDKVLDKADIREMQSHARQVIVAPHVQAFVTRAVMGTHPEAPEASERTKKYVRYGASPRGAQAMLLTAKANALLDGRFNVSFDDLIKVAKPSLRHRIILSFEGEADAINIDELIDHVVATARDHVAAKF